MAAGDVYCNIEDIPAINAFDSNETTGLILAQFSELTVIPNTAADQTTSFFVFLRSYVTSPQVESYFVQHSASQRNIKIKSTGKLSFQCQNGTSLESASTIPLNEWVHICCLRTGNLLKIYIDGVLDATSAALAPGSASIANVGLASAYGGAGAFSVKGGFREFCFYRRALDLAEIQNLANNTSVTLGRIAYFPLTNNYIDYSGKNFHLGATATNITFKGFAEDLTSEIKNKRVTDNDKYFLNSEDNQIIFSHIEGV